MTRVGTEGKRSQAEGRTGGNARRDQPRVLIPHAVPISVTLREGRAFESNLHAVGKPLRNVKAQRAVGWRAKAATIFVKRQTAIDRRARGQPLAHRDGVIRLEERIDGPGAELNVLVLDALVAERVRVLDGSADGDRRSGGDGQP